MQLDCSWASSGTTSNDITSICDVHHQQRSHLKGTVNRHLSRLAGREAPLPTEKEARDRAMNLSISSTVLLCRSGPQLNGTLARQRIAVSSQDVWRDLLQGPEVNFDGKGSMW